MPTNKADLRPLDLSVHTQPSMQSPPPDGQQSQLQRKGRWKMLVVLLVCAAPVVASYFTYYVIRPEGRRNFGELIEPQKPMPDSLRAQSLEGRTVPLAQLKGQWLLVSTSDAACGPQCERHLYLQRQLREGLGREKDRMDWVWLIQDGQQPPVALQSALHQAQVLQVDGKQLHSWLSASSGQHINDHLYVVDPLGNLMMRFPAHLDTHSAPKAKRDLERLLRASSSWDKAGR